MPNQYDLFVVSNQLLTPHMRRIKVYGKCLDKFPTDYEIGYVKVNFSKKATEKVVRSYTVREFDSDSNELTLDFVDHGDLGPASRWAQKTKKGDPISIFGPGSTRSVDATADWYLIGGDMSALPAIGASIKYLRPDAKGYVVVEILSAEDKQNLNPPDGMEVIWVNQEKNDVPNDKLTSKIRSLPWLPGRVFPWFAGEFDGMRNMRTYFRDEKNIDKKAMYLSCYWKNGDTDEGMKIAKRKDAEAESKEALAQ